MDAVIPFLKHLIEKKVITTQDCRVDEIVERAKKVRLQINWEKEQRIDLKARNIKPVQEAIKTGAWRGSRCFVVGGGPSLQKFNFNLLRGEKIIAVNRAYEKLPFADIMISMDSRYFQWIDFGEMDKKMADGKDALSKYVNFKGLKVWVDTHFFHYKNIYAIKGINATGLTFSLEEGIYHGNNSGYAAINLAICLGANPIYLLGFDMKFGKAGKTHWHQGYPARIDIDTIKRYIPHFRYIANAIHGTRFKIINLNPDSAITCFPKQRIEEVLK